MSRPYRQLLPLVAAPPNDGNLETGTGASSGGVPSSDVTPDRNVLRQPTVAQVQKRRRDTSSIACNACRAKKTACDRLRPACTPCTDRKTNCVYRASLRAQDAASDALQRQVGVLQQRLHDQADMLQELASLPPEAAVEVLRFLQTSREPFSVLSSLRGSMHGQMRPSEHMAARGAAPPTFSSTEFELVPLHRAVYASVEPAATTSLRALIDPCVLVSVASPSSPSAASSSSPMSVPASTRAAATVSESNSGTPSSELLLDAPPSSRTSFDSRPASPSANLPPGGLCDARLRHLRIECWTNVPISNELAASVLSFYINFDHRLFSIFDVDLFLSDLISCRSDFCSSFLVNALLFLSCQAYTALDMNISSCVHSFFQEAELLYHGLGNSTSLMTICASQIFSMGCYFHGQDELALEALMHGRRLAESLQLFGVMPHLCSNIDHFRNQTSNWLRAACHVAWGSYCWLSVHVFYYNGEPIRHPPILPIPGRNSQRQDGSLYHIDLPSSINWSPFDNTAFPVICHFWVIAQEVATVYLGTNIDRGRPLSEQVPLAFAEEKYQKLLSWTDDMAEAIKDRESTQALVFQIWFHTTVLHLFRPFLKENVGSGKGAPQKLTSFSAGDGSPETVFDASIQQLKHLVYVYMCKISEMPLSGFFNAAFVHVGHAMLQRYRHKKRRSDQEETEPEELLDDTEDATEDIAIADIQPAVGQARSVLQDARLHFLVCVRAWIDLYVCYPTFAEFTQAFLSMALEAGIMSGTEAQAILVSISERGRHHAPAKQISVSSLIDFDIAYSHPEDASAHTLALKFDDLATFSEFTSAEDFIADDDVGGGQVA